MAKGQITAVLLTLSPAEAIRLTALLALLVRRCEFDEAPEELRLITGIAQTIRLQLGLLAPADPAKKAPYPL